MEFKRWNVAANGSFQDIKTSTKKHPLILERAGDFNEEMQKNFFLVISHILQAAVNYPDTFHRQLPHNISETVYRVFRFEELGTSFAPTTQLALKLVLWYTDQGPRFGYDLHRFRQVWAIAMQMVDNGFNLFRRDRNRCADILLVMFFSMDGRTDEINWDLAKMIQHKEVSPLFEAYLQDKPDPIKCTEWEQWVDVWDEEYVAPHQKVIAAVDSEGLQRYSYAGLFKSNGLSPFDGSLVTMSQGISSVKKIGDNEPVSTEKPAASSAGDRSLNLLRSTPLFPARSLDYSKANRKYITEVSYLAANVLPPLLRARWELYRPSKKVSNSAEDGAEKPEENHGGDQKEVDPNHEPQSEISLELGQISDVAARVATEAVKKSQDQAAPVENAVEDGQAPLSAATDAKKAMDQGEALQQPFSMDGASTLNRDSAIQKRSMPSSPVPQPAVQGTPTKPSSPTRRETRSSASASKQ